MHSTQIVTVGRELLITAIMLAAPTLLVSLFVGLIVSVFQALTSIQEQTLNFAPRILAVAVVLIITLPWMLNVLVHFTQRMFLVAVEISL